MGRKPIRGFTHARSRLTTFDVRDIYLDAAIRLQVFELFFGDQFGRDLAYLARLVTARKIDPQLAGELPWDQMPVALERLRNRDVAGNLALTVGDWCWSLFKNRQVVICLGTRLSRMSDQRCGVYRDLCKTLPLLRASDQDDRSKTSRHGWSTWN